MLLRRRLSRVLLICGCLFIGLGVSYGGLMGYLVWRESDSPSTRQVLVLKDGRRIPLVQPTTPPAPSTPSAPLALVPGAEAAEAATPTPVAPPGAATPVPAPPTLPPLRIVIARLGLDWPVVLSDNDHMPRFKGVGWFMGSAFPGAPGNLVLFGHLDGPYATFGRLHELAAGDEIAVITEAATQRYVVQGSRQVLPDAVEVLAPTSDPTLTLITCSGAWDKLTAMYDHRLVVTARYLTP